MSDHVVCFDKDSTLGRSTHRRWMIPEILDGKRTWAEYSRACAGDEPVEGALRLMRMLAPFYQVHVMSGATDCLEARAWLDRHGFPYHAVWMRQEGDETENALLKVRWLREVEQWGDVVELFVEDDPEAAEVIRQETGVPVLVLNPCYAEELAAIKALRMEGRHGSSR